MKLVGDLWYHIKSSNVPDLDSKKAKKMVSQYREAKFKIVPFFSRDRAQLKTLKYLY